MNNGQSPEINLYKPAGSGVKIMDIVKENDKKMTNNDYSRDSYNDNIHKDRSSHNERSHNERGHNDERSSHNEHLPDEYLPKSSKIQNDNESIKELARSVNESLKRLEKRERYKSKEYYQDDQDKHQDNKGDEIILQTIDTDNDYLKLIIEFLVLLTLYVIMSQPFTVSFLSGYISQLNPNDDGVVNMSGIVIYGFILTTLFFLTRRLLFSRF